MIDANDLQREVDSFGWYHTIDLGNGVRTRGFSDNNVPESLLPDLAGRTVLDIGAWDGYYSFLAERLGARRVVALDHYAWGVDIEARDRYWKECREAGTLPDLSKDTTDFWRDDLPWQRGFNLARRVLGSNVEPVVADFMTTGPDVLGTFDVVFCLGVLYHLKEPLTGLARVRALTTEVAVIETVATDIFGHEDEALIRFLRDGEYGSGIDFGNWFVPSLTALRGLCQAAGFSRTEVARGPATRPVDSPPRLSLRERLEILRSGERPPELPRPPTNEFRAVVRAYV